MTQGSAPDGDAADRSAAQGHAAYGQTAHGGDQAEGAAAQAHETDREAAQGEDAAGQAADGEEARGHVADGHHPAGMAAELARLGIGSAGDGEKRQVSDGQGRSVADPPPGAAHPHPEARYLGLELHDASFQIARVGHRRRTGTDAITGHPPGGEAAALLVTAGRRSFIDR